MNLIKAFLVPALLLAPIRVSAATPAPAVIKVKADFSKPGLPISPLVFGVSFPKEAHRDIARIPL